jgi:hypothetical protein
MFFVNLHTALKIPQKKLVMTSTLGILHIRALLATIWDKGLLMNVQKIPHLAYRLKELGIRGVITWSTTKSYRHFFGLCYKVAASTRHANHTWRIIMRRFGQDDTFAQFFILLASNKTFDRMLATEQFARYFPSTLANDPELFTQVDELCDNKFSILGSAKINFGTTTPWHYDIKLPPEQWGTEYWNQPPLQFYQNITTQEPSSSGKDYYPDIKVPWELSRLQHLFVLGCAYRRALAIKDHERANRYSATFVAHVQSWISNNPYLLGVNWVCPMEVAIRAVNLIWGFHLFKGEQTIPLEFWEHLVCSIYDHAYYLEYNKETSDKPNNHYIADLVGALYLSVFFKNIKHFYRQQSTILNEIWQQTKQQIQPDGTSYEGSTNYHKLVTEMLGHVALICTTEGITMPPFFMFMLRNMKAFLQDCTDLSGNLVQIGDNDSGKFVTGITIALNTLPHLISYRYAGITIMNVHGWHVTYRHPTFNPRQPTGHFHADELAITVSLDGKPLLIDPGTYLYTGSKTWRNTLRSAQAHNTYFIPNFEYKSHELFQLPRRPQEHEPTVSIEAHTVVICDRHLKYANRGLVAYRKLIFDMRNEFLELHDWWQPSDDHPNFFNRPHEHECVWNFHWAPDAQLHQNESHAWIVCRKNKPIVHVTSTLSFTCYPDSFSPGYGIKEPSFTLTAVHPLTLRHRSLRLHRF